MDERLSQPKRVTNRFIGFNEDAQNTIENSPYENTIKKANTTFNKRSMSTAADMT